MKTKGIKIGIIIFLVLSIIFTAIGLYVLSDNNEEIHYKVSELYTVEVEGRTFICNRLEKDPFMEYYELHEDYLSKTTKSEKVIIQRELRNGNYFIYSTPNKVRAESMAKKFNKNFLINKN